ncbi:alpha/beta hydrolase [Pantoea brenneri]|uniref:alpha/beta fold hydrolase n=1 Tax=Pantoea brenneri TaxID=472694 RepID=UPI0028971205|nr:alpha/beta hydrolase [Pantoea brenneri]
MNEKKFSLSRRNLLAFTSATVLSAALKASPARAAPKVSSTARLFYTEKGQGKNIMVLHGWTCDSHDWSWQLPVLESKYRTVAVDLRGHGRSEVMPSGHYAPADYVADIESLILTHYPGQKFILIGHSMGGQIAARLAAKRPDLVSAVVSVDGSMGFADAQAALFQKATDDLQNSDPYLTGPALFELFYDKNTSLAFKRWHERRLQGVPLQVVRESFGPLFLGPGQVGVGKASEEFCRSLTVPVYHLCRDAVQAETMRRWFANPKSKTDYWTDTGHWIMQDRSDEVNHAVTAWIDRL